MGRRFYLALVVASVVTVTGAWAIKELRWDEATDGIIWWGLLLVGILTASLVDREGFYGRGDEQ